MKFMKWGRDGGPESGVYGFWLVEIKSLFSIVFLRFEADQRESFHSHAFNAVTWWLSGAAWEYHRGGGARLWRPSWRPKWTPRSCYHKVIPVRRTWALSIRGPWAKQWREFNYRTNTETVLENGRRVVQQEVRK